MDRKNKLQSHHTPLWIVQTSCNLYDQGSAPGGWVSFRYGVLRQLRPVCRNCPKLKPITSGILCQIDGIGYEDFPHFRRKQRIWSLLLNKSHARLPRVPVLRGQSAAVWMGGRGNRVSCEWPRVDESRRESSCGRRIGGMLKRRTINWCCHGQHCGSRDLSLLSPLRKRWSIAGRRLNLPCAL
jgi:hypothetical protein